MTRLTLAACVLGLLGLLAAPAVAQSNPQPTIPRGGGMFPNVPSGSQNNQPNRSGMFPNVPVVTLNKPAPVQPGGPPPRRDGRPIIVVTPGWVRQGTAAGDPRLQALQSALRGATGVPVNWSDGNSFGQVIPVGERLISGMNCRDLSQSVTSLGETQTGSSIYCLTPAGEWMLAGP